MPRELVHWHVVDLLAEELRLHSGTCADVLDRYRNAAYLGAIVHDAPYYYGTGSSAHALHVAEVLHGKNGEDTFEPLLRIARCIQSDQGETTDLDLAFLYGMVSHAVTDMHFHPMIIFLTGNYYHADRKKRRVNRGAHRLFEVFLDSYITPRATCPRLVCAVLNDEILARAPFLLSHINESTHFWELCIRHTAWYQKRFKELLSGLTMRFVSSLLPTYFKEFDALFSFGRSTPPQFFGEPIAYRNPVSGQERTSSIEDLLHASVSHTAKIIHQMHDGHFTEKGASLSYGIVGAKNDEAIYFKDSA